MSNGISYFSYLNRFMESSLRAYKMKTIENTSALVSLWTPLPPTCVASKPPAPTTNIQPHK